MLKKEGAGRIGADTALNEEIACEECRKLNSLHQLALSAKNE
jgi:hypothetical protein